MCQTLNIMQLLYAHPPLYKMLIVDIVDNQLMHCPHSPHGKKRGEWAR